jgi:hypothetical protein
MRDTSTNERPSNGSDDHSDFVNYLPGMPRLSGSPGRVERFLTRLLRRRGGLRVVVRRRD